MSAEDLDAKEPVFVECHAGGVNIFPRSGEPVTVVREALEDAGSPLGLLLGSLEADRGRRYLVLLVRPSGIESFNVCRNLAYRRGLEVGKDAVFEKGELHVRARGGPAKAAKVGD